MEDAAHKAADAAVEAWKAEVAETYRQAQLDAQEALSRFLARFEEQDAKRRAKVEAGELSREDWMAWRKGQMLTGQRLSATLDQVAQAYSHANEVAVAALAGRLPEVYAENANFAAFQTCKASGLDLAFSLVDAPTVQHMLTAGEALFHVPALDVAKDVAWNRRLMASQLTQGVLLGESIPKMARRVQSVTGSNMATATRTARTAVTGAENAGRVSSYRAAKDMGISLKQEWVAALDNRTRHSHRQLDGEKAEVGVTFSNGCRFPGDPQGRYAEICNCRCTLVAAVEGFETDDAKRASKLPKGMTYEEWKAGESGKRAAEALRSSISGGQAVSANAVRSIVGKRVPLGPSAGKSAASYIDLQGMGERGAELFDRAVSYVPTAMLETVKRGKVKAVRDLSRKRDESPERSEFDPVTNTITIRRGSDELEIVHELMHAVEEHDPEFLEAEREYFEKRTRGKTRKRLEDITGNTSYDDLELAYDVGSCIDPYAFKDYGGDGYELMSMGVEMLYRSPSSYLKDPDMLKWVLTMIGRFG